MTKAELVKQIAARAGITQVCAGRVLEAVLSTLSEVMVADDSVTLAGFGTFKLSPHRERRGRNPANGESIVIPARKSPRFAPGKELRALIEKS